MGSTRDTGEYRGGQRPPLSGSERPQAIPFGRWASKNRVKVAVAVIGGLALNVANAWGYTLFRRDATDQPRAAIVRIEAGEKVCWKVTLGLGNRHERACGNATFRMKAHSGDPHLYAPDMTFFAAVNKTYQEKVTGRVGIVLVVEGETVDHASTLYDSASVSY